MDLPRGEENANTYAQDITDDDRLLSTPTVEDRSQAEIDEMLTQQESTRNRQAKALGIQSYDPDYRAKIAQRAKGELAAAKKARAQRDEQEKKRQKKYEEAEAWFT